jgi:O-acetyl-ADP-ribose deacetylase (regulator of RNase III)
LEIVDLPRKIEKTERNLKMTIKIINGDLLLAKEDILAHQVNCRSKMASGIAIQLRNKYSVLYPAYKKLCSKYLPQQLLGQCQIVDCGDKIVANLFGQLNYGRDQSKVYTDYSALEKSFSALKNTAQLNQLSIAMPMFIGCGLANGDWKVVEKIIESVFSDYEVTLYKI